MSSVIKYKFKNAKDSDVILFEGISLPLDALKRAIVDKKGLHESGADLIITDASTNEGAIELHLIIRNIIYFPLNRCL
jgi:hypothetical protein